MAATFGEDQAADQVLRYCSTNGGRGRLTPSDKFPCLRRPICGKLCLASLHHRSTSTRIPGETTAHGAMTYLRCAAVAPISPGARGGSVVPLKLLRRLRKNLSVPLLLRRSRAVAGAPVGSGARSQVFSNISFFAKQCTPQNAPACGVHLPDRR